MPIVRKKSGLTFGVNTPTMYGANMPVVVPIQFVMPVNVLANTGLKSIGFNIVPTVISPWAPVDIMKSVTTSSSSQPAYDAANMKNAGTTDAIRIEG